MNGTDRARRRLRAPVAALAVVVVGLALAAPVRAYEARLVPTTPIDQVAVGDLVTFEFFLDHEGLTAVHSFEISLGFDPAVLDYRLALSHNSDYYYLYAPPIDDLPHTFLLPVHVPPRPVGGYGSDTSPIKLTYGSDHPGIPWTRTVDDLWFATFTFEAIAPGSSVIEWGFLEPSDEFVVESEAGGPVDVSANVPTPGDVTVSVIPEPASAILLGGGVLGLAVARRRARGGWARMRMRRGKPIG